ncbi:MAG: hypothetical protein HY675_20325 [Chloroflexi bacterium]|nr:hypothetical protein [Chloroflexota bacterium]
MRKYRKTVSIALAFVLLLAVATVATTLGATAVPSDWRTANGMVSAESGALDRSTISSPGTEQADVAVADPAAWMKSKTAGKVPFFFFGSNGGLGEKDVQLVRAEPPFDTLASYDNIPGTGGSWMYTSKDDRFFYVKTGAPYVVQIATSDFEMRKIYTQDYHSFVVSPDDKYMYTVNYAQGRILKHEIATGQVVKEVVWGQTRSRAKGTYLVTVQGPAGGGSASALSPDGRYWYLTPEQPNANHPEFKNIYVWKYDLQSDEIVGSVDVGARAGAHMSNFITPDGGTMFLNSFSGKYVKRINLQTMTVEDTWEDASFDNSNWHAIHPEASGKRFWILLDKGESGYAAVFDTGPGKLVDNLVGFVGPFPRDMESPTKRVLHMVEFTPDNKYAITDNMYLDEAYVIDVEKLSVIKTINVGNARKGEALRHDWYGTDHPILSPDAKYFGVAVVYDNTYEIYDTETGELMQTVQFPADTSTHYTRGWWPGYQMGNVLYTRTQPKAVPGSVSITPNQQTALIPPQELLGTLAAEVQPAAAPEATAGAAESTAVGKQLFEQKCNACHRAPAVSEYPKWQGQLGPMSQGAGLSAEQLNQVRQYLESAH